MLRNLHFARPLSASLQKTSTQAEVNSVVAAAVDALNIDQYATDTEVSTAVSDALVLYYTAEQVDAEIAFNGFDASQYWTRTESDSRYFAQTANAGFTSLIRNTVTPPTMRALLPRAPLSTNVLFNSNTLELLCDAYSKAEADGRYVQSGNLQLGFEVLRDHGQCQLHAPSLSQLTQPAQAVELPPRGYSSMVTGPRSRCSRPMLAR